ncbi:hypothetical protein H0H93_014305, partial [Arthromyces matolae]
MSSNEDNENENATTKKRKVVQRACDHCRSRKGDGGQTTADKCSNCSSGNFDCTYLDSAKKPIPKGYVERLETRLEKLEKLLTKLYPDLDILKVIDSLDDTEACLTEHFPRPNPEKSDHPLASTTQRSYDMATSVIRKVAQPQPAEPAVDDFADVKLANHIANLRIRDRDKKTFFGKSSEAMLIRDALELKKETTGGIRAPTHLKRKEFWTAHP